MLSILPYDYYVLIFGVWVWVWHCVRVFTIVCDGFSDTLSDISSYCSH